MVVAQPLLALKSPLLLLPPVFVAQACLHSGFQCGYFPCNFIMLPTRLAALHEGLFILPLSTILYIHNMLEPAV